MLTKRNLWPGVDRAYDISRTEMDVLKLSHGIMATCVYLDAPSEYHAWSPSTVRALSGYRFLPTYVPKQGGSFDSPVLDATRAAAELMRFGWPGGKRVPCALDIEAHTYDANPLGTVFYCQSWANELQSRGYSPVIYGTPRTIIACDRAGLDAGYWAAYPLSKGFSPELRPLQLMRVFNLQHMGQGGKIRGWQYAFEVSVNGVGSPVDLNIWRGNLAKEPQAYA